MHSWNDIWLTTPFSLVLAKGFEISLYNVTQMWAKSVPKTNSGLTCLPRWACCRRSQASPRCSTASRPSSRLHITKTCTIISLWCILSIGKYNTLILTRCEEWNGIPGQHRSWRSPCSPRRRWPPCSSRGHRSRPCCGQSPSCPVVQLNRHIRDAYKYVLIMSGVLRHVGPCTNDVS